MSADSKDNNAEAADDSREASGGSPFARLLSLLDLFSVDRTSLNIDEVVTFLGIGKSTAYKHLKDLCDAGLFVPRGKGAYGLGPRIIELERQLQLTDPLLIAGKQAMQDDTPLCKNRAVLLCTLYRDRVLCVHRVGPETIFFGKEPMPIVRARGTALPLFKGAGSQVILAHLLAHQIRALYLSNAGAIASAGLGDDWTAFRSNMTRIRKAGYATTTGQVNPHMLSISIPVFADDKVIGSLLLLTANSAQERDATDELVLKLREVGTNIERLLGASNHD